MSNTVIIPTAGLGSRMGNYTKHINKALLPYKGRPVLSHIIDQFPNDTRFIIPVGYLAEQIQDFVQVAYPDRNIVFVNVDDYTSESSGPAYTLKQAADLIDGPFWYITCDTYFDEQVIDKVNENNCYFIKYVNEKDSHLYTMFDIDVDSKIKEITFKKSQPPSWAAFTGMMYIYNWQQYLIDLANLNSVEFIYLIEKGGDTASLDSWMDFGCPEMYKTAYTKSHKYDFSKKDEVTYICNNKVVKWWLDSTIPKKKYDKVLKNPKVFPTNCKYHGNFMAYDYFEGQTLYEFNDPDVFDDLLNWLETNVWQDSAIDIYTASIDFYKTKSLHRISKFLEKYPNIKNVTNIDNVKVKDYSYYLNKIDWEYLATTTRPGFLHGDLQFDNIVISDSREFKIIDWRHEFAGLVEYGDIYYDLAKMSGGLIINYANIKNHNFNIEIDNDSVTLSIPNVDYITEYQYKLKKYIVNNNLDYKKVKQLVPIIFWNMSPLHTAPFDIFLWYLGIKLFAELDNE